MKQTISINWHDGYANAPTAIIDTDMEDTPKVLYRSYHLNEGGGMLSSEQEAAVGRPDRGTPCEVLYGEDPESGYVHFIVAGGLSGGACGGTFKMEDGSERHVSSGWHVSASVVRSIAPVIDVAWGTTRYKIRMAAFCKLERVEALLAEQMPEVVLVPDRYHGYTFKWKGMPTKAEWDRKERELGRLPKPIPYSEAYSKAQQEADHRRAEAQETAEYWDERNRRNDTF